MENSVVVAQTAAQWWTEKLAQISLDNFCLSEKGLCSLFLMFRMLLQASKHTATNEQLEAFYKSLCTRIEKKITQSSSSEFCIECEFVPCSLLEETASLVGINSCLFPVKRSMWINSHSIRVKDGCGAVVTEIFSSP